MRTPRKSSLLGTAFFALLVAVPAHGVSNWIFMSTLRPGKQRIVRRRTPRFGTLESRGNNTVTGNPGGATSGTIGSFSPI